VALWSRHNIRTNDQDATLLRAFSGILASDLLLRVTGFYNFLLNYTRNFLISSPRKREKRFSLIQKVDPYFWRPLNDQLASGYRFCCHLLVAVPNWYDRPNVNWRLCLVCFFHLCRP